MLCADFQEQVREVLYRTEIQICQGAAARLIGAVGEHLHRHTGLAADFLENYDADEREVTKTIIGTISGLDTPLTPSMDGKRSMSMYLTKTPLEVIQKEREQVLACTKEDIRNTADAVRKIANTENICVIGNEKRIKDEASLFESIKPLS